MARTHGTILERNDREEPENRFMLKPEDRTELELGVNTWKEPYSPGLSWKQRDDRVKLETEDRINLE